MLLSALRFNNISKPITESDSARPDRWLRSLHLAFLLLCVLLVAESHAADKIIYIRPVPMNEDPLLRLGTTGVNQAALMYGMEASTLASQPTREGRQQQLDAALKQNPKVVVLLGFEFKELVANVARQAPNTRFFLLEHCVDNAPPNLTCIQFRETEASYLAGIAAGLTSHNGKVGMIAAFDTPVRRQNAEAFAAGAIAAKPTISVYDPQWIGGEQPFNDPARGEQVAKAMLAAGVDTIFSTAAVSNQGVFRAVAAQPKARVIGHPVNQCRVLPGKVLDNVEVHLDIAILLAVGEALRGTVRERMDFGLREGALSMTSLSPDAALSECEITKERALLLKLREAKKIIISRK
ncbi:BMP family ABC transporter substrate-binding protein [Undibacterium arcticum]|uniref:BMP family ABC transporter substrate-binding protein n=2 Tax=Undibacterium arcticum TaxID=1762892 RepID=A0ABV7F2D5_9BURK